MKLQAPDGADIIGTVETIPGVAIIINSDFEPAGKDGRYFLDDRYEGDTEVDCDGQETITHLGQRVFQDENGKQWLERELKLVPEENN